MQFSAIQKDDEKVKKQCMYVIKDVDLCNKIYIKKTLCVQSLACLKMLKFVVYYFGNV